MIRKSFKYRLYPNNKQATLLDKHFGCVRFIYNWGLAEKTKVYQETGKSLSRYDLQNKLPEMKKTDNPWLCEVNAQSLQSALTNLDRAFLNFFKHKAKFPQFKKKNGNQSFQIPQNGQIVFETNKLIIPKFLEGIPCKISRQFIGKSKTITISKTTTGKYFASVLVETLGEIPEKQPITPESTIGIDVGIKNFCVLSTGEKIDNPKYLKENLKRLKILQHRASKKKNGSKNRKKINLKVAKFYEKISNKRNDFLHKLTHRLTNENQIDSLAIENLNISGLLKNHCLAQAISDVSWSKFYQQLGYKSEWYGINLLKIGRFEPSSRTCSCGIINTNLLLKNRKWTCSVCGLIHDRDILAAQNIKKFALISDNLKHSGLE